MEADALMMLAAGLLVVTGLALVAAGLRTTTGTSLEQLLDLDDDATLDEFSERMQQSLSQRVFAPMGASIGQSFASLLPRNLQATVRRRLVLAGLSGRVSPDEYLAQQVVLAAGGIVVGVAVAFAAGWPGGRLVAAGILGGLAGAALPALRVRQARDLRVQSIERDLPDVLDLLAISVEAGVGLEGALHSAVDRFHSPLGDELAHALSEMELGQSRREALHNLRSRTEVPPLTGFIMSLLQADALGMPLTQVLRAQAAELRRRRTQKVREAAARLPVKLLFPLVLFILPALFTVILGPAVLRILRTF